MTLRALTLLFVLCLVCFLWLAQVLAQWASQQQHEAYQEYLKTLENLAPQCRAAHPRDPVGYGECMGQVEDW